MIFFWCRCAGRRRRPQLGGFEAWLQLCLLPLLPGDSQVPGEAGRFGLLWRLLHRWRPWRDYSGVPHVGGSLHLGASRRVWHNKGPCFLPDLGVSADVLRCFDLPQLMPVFHDGPRVLGASIVPGDFKGGFAASREAGIISDLEFLRVMSSLQMQNGLANSKVEDKP